MLIVLGAAPARAEAVRLEIISREPVNGSYELIKGRIHGEIDPKAPHNAIIQDIARKEAPPYEKWRLRKQAQQAVLAFADPELQSIA